MRKTVSVDLVPAVIDEEMIHDAMKKAYDRKEVTDHEYLLSKHLWNIAELHLGFRSWTILLTMPNWPTLNI